MSNNNQKDVEVTWTVKNSTSTPERKGRIPPVRNYTIDLSILDNEEQKKLNEVIQRDLLLNKEVDGMVSNLKKEIKYIRKAGALSGEDTQSAMCARCKYRFWLIFVPFVDHGTRCFNCKFNVCRKCRVKQANNLFLCSLCLRQRKEKWLTGDWLHGNQCRGLFGSDLLRASLRDKAYFQALRDMIERKKRGLSGKVSNLMGLNTNADTTENCSKSSHCEKSVKGKVIEENKTNSGDSIEKRSSSSTHRRKHRKKVNRSEDMFPSKSQSVSQHVESMECRENCPSTVQTSALKRRKSFENKNNLIDEKMYRKKNDRKHEAEKKNILQRCGGGSDGVNQVEVLSDSRMPRNKRNRFADENVLVKDRESLKSCNSKSYRQRERDRTVVVNKRQEEQTFNNMLDRNHVKGRSCGDVRSKEKNSGERVRRQTYNDTDCKRNLIQLRKLLDKKMDELEREKMADRREAQKCVRTMKKIFRHRQRGKLKVRDEMFEKRKNSTLNMNGRRCRKSQQLDEREINKCKVEIPILKKHTERYLANEKLLQQNLEKKRNEWQKSSSGLDDVKLSSRENSSSNKRRKKTKRNEIQNGDRLYTCDRDSPSIAPHFTARKVTPQRALEQTSELLKGKFWNSQSRENNYLDSEQSSTSGVQSLVVSPLSVTTHNSAPGAHSRIKTSDRGKCCTGRGSSQTRQSVQDVNYSFTPKNVKDLKHQKNALKEQKIKEEKERQALKRKEKEELEQLQEENERKKKLGGAFSMFTKLSKEHPNSLQDDYGYDDDYYAENGDGGYADGGYDDGGYDDGYYDDGYYDGGYYDDNDGMDYRQRQTRIVIAPGAMDDENDMRPIKQKFSQTDLHMRPMWQAWLCPFCRVEVELGHDWGT